MKFNIIDNFIDEKDFLTIKSVLRCRDFPWFIVENADRKGTPNFMMTHTFYNYDKPNSDYFDLLTPIRNRLGINSIVTEKANLTFYDDGVPNLYHVDYDHKGGTTSLFYLDDNGGTFFKINDKEEYVEAKPNRMVTFNTDTLHKVVRHKSGDIFRTVLNFNYF